MTATPATMRRSLDSAAAGMLQHRGWYEEYHPYGSTAWWAGDSVLVSQKRYRYTGMERDEETGLQCHGRRYYAVWLGRWTSADPIGLGDGVNRYGYCHGGPAGKRDGSGLLTDQDAEGVSASRTRHEVGAPARAAPTSKPAGSKGDEGDYPPSQSNSSAGATEGSGGGALPLPRLPNAGFSAANWRDTTKRVNYKAKILERSKRAMDEVKAARLAGDLERARSVAKAASAGRNDLRAATQLELSPGGHALSKALEGDRSFEVLELKYARPDSFDTYETIAAKAGSSAPSMELLTLGGRVAGPLATGLAIGGATFEVAVAPPGKKLRAVEGQVGRAEFGFVAGEGGMVLGALAADAGAAALGMSGPPGWVVLGCMLVGGVTAAGYGGDLGQAVGEGGMDARMRPGPDGRPVDLPFYRPPK